MMIINAVNYENKKSNLFNKRHGCSAAAAIITKKYVYETY